MRASSIILDPAQRSRDLRNEVRERVASRAAAAEQARNAEAARCSEANRLHLVVWDGRRLAEQGSS